MTPQGPAPRDAPHRLADLAVFAGLPLPILDELAQDSRLRRYPADQVLWNEGDPRESMVVLVTG